MLSIIMQNPNLGQNELSRRVDVARDTLRKDLASLEEQDFIVDKGKQKKGAQAKWCVVDESYAKHHLAEQSSRESLTQRIGEGRITSVEIPFSRLLEESLPKHIVLQGSPEDMIRRGLTEAADSAPVIKLSFVNYGGTPVPNEYVGKCVKDLADSAYNLPIEQLILHPKHYSEDECVEILSKVRYSVVVDVDFSNMIEFLKAMVMAGFRSVGQQPPK